MISDRDLAKLLTQAGQDPGSFVGTASQMNADGTVTITGVNGTVTAIAQTAFRSGSWSAKRVGNTWYAWSENSPLVQSETTVKNKRRPLPKKASTGFGFILLLDVNFSEANATPFLQNLLNFFKVDETLKIYSLVDSPGEGFLHLGGTFSRQNFFFPDFPYPVGTGLKYQYITLQELDLVDSLLVIPLIYNYSFTPGYSEDTIKKIKQIAQKSGVILLGENGTLYAGWPPANTYLMNTFYKPFYRSYSYDFPSVSYFEKWGINSSSKKSKIIFKGIEGEVTSGYSHAIPSYLIKKENRLAIINHEGTEYTTAVAWNS